jgi:peptide-methionine (R)-S-oxide reductase
MTEKVIKTDAEWRAELSPEAYRVTRQHGTERPFTNDNFPKGEGMFRCVACGQPLFDADTKYDSGSGWPSFYEPAAEGAVEETVDRSLGMRRTEVHCARCESHLGHVFPDGPQPTGLRYCINGAALRFDPERDAPPAEAGGGA